MLFCTTAISIGDNWSVYKCRLYFSAPFLFHFSLKRSRSAKKSNSFLRVSWDDKVISSYDLPKTICICLLLDKIQTDAKLNGMRNKCKASDQITNNKWWENVSFVWPQACMSLHIGVIIIATLWKIPRSGPRTINDCWQPAPRKSGFWVQKSYKIGIEISRKTDKILF